MTVLFTDELDDDLCKKADGLVERYEKGAITLKELAAYVAKGFQHERGARLASATAKAEWVRRDDRRLACDITDCRKPLTFNRAGTAAGYCDEHFADMVNAMEYVPDSWKRTADTPERCGCVKGIRLKVVKHCGGHGIPPDEPVYMPGRAAIEAADGRAGYAQARYNALLDRCRRLVEKWERGPSEVRAANVPEPVRRLLKAGAVRAAVPEAFKGT